jgi:uncharacterized protein YkwD
MAVWLCIGADSTPDLRPPLTSEEKSILDLTNKAREEKKLPALSVNTILTQVARDHSKNMANKGEMNHVLDGKNPADRVKAAGYRYFYTGENVAMGENVTIAEIFDSWMKSKAHRENILNENYREIGIGIARDDKGRVYYTQEFGSRER